MWVTSLHAVKNDRVLASPTTKSQDKLLANELNVAPDGAQVSPEFQHGVAMLWGQRIFGTYCLVRQNRNGHHFALNQRGNGDPKTGRRRCWAEDNARGTAIVGNDW